MTASETTKPGHVTGPVLGVLLAGGQSRRMGGGDKCLRQLGGRPMLAHVVERLAPQVDRIVLNANGEPSRFAPFRLPVVADPVEGFAGPLAGVLAGLRWAQAHVPDARFVVTAATDTPFFPTDLVTRLMAAAEREERIVLAASGGRRHPVFGLWPVSLADDLERFLREEESRKVMVWVERHPNAVCEFPEKPDPFFNTNEPDDLALAERRLREGVA